MRLFEHILVIDVPHSKDEHGPGPTSAVADVGTTLSARLNAQVKVMLVPENRTADEGTELRSVTL
jgi:hypothetical protein